MEKDFLKEQQFIKAKKKVKDIKGFYSHLVVYVIVNIFISGIILYGLTYDGNDDFNEAMSNFGVYSTWLFWGIGLFFHWLSVFGFKSFLGKNWEDKKIKEIMEQDQARSDKFSKK